MTQQTKLILLYAATKLYGKKGEEADMPAFKGLLSRQQRLLTLEFIRSLTGEKSED